MDMDEWMVLKVIFSCHPANVMLRFLFFLCMYDRKQANFRPVLRALPLLLPSLVFEAYRNSNS